ncbi:MAG: GDYXXLXY domain-containing protein [Pseudomonadota bacterium]
MMQTAARAFFLLVLPVAGLGALWWQSEDLSRQGTDWEVPIQGYDPRDLLRGHYVEFRYDWPIRPVDADGAQAIEGAFRPTPQINHLCLIGDPPLIAEAIAFDDPTDPLFEQCEHKLSVQPGSVYGYASLSQGRLYVGQDRALELEENLRETDQRGLVTFRQREDGVLTPLDIRFRPLTEDEREDREPAAVFDAAINR